MNESDHTHGQLDKDRGALNQGHEHTSIKSQVFEDTTTKNNLKISDIVNCCPPGQDKPVITTSAEEGKEEELRLFYKTYDPTVGLHTAAVLGGILVLLILYLFYKTKCKKVVKKGFLLVRDKLSGKQFEKLDQPASPEMPNITRLMAKTGAWIRIDSPGVLPTIEVDSLEATAQWVQNHPVEIQGLHDVTGIILKIDPDFIQSHGHEKIYRTSKSDFQLSNAQRSDSVDSLRKTMLAHNHIGAEASRTYLTVPSVCTWGHNLLTQGSSSYPNIRQLNYAAETWKLPLPKRPTDCNQKQKTPVHICNSSNIQIHRTKSDDFSGLGENGVNNSDSETSDSDLCEEPLLQQVVVETTPATEQYLWSDNCSPENDKVSLDSLQVNEPLADLKLPDSHLINEEQTDPVSSFSKMETML